MAIAPLTPRSEHLAWGTGNSRAGHDIHSEHQGGGGHQRGGAERNCATDQSQVPRGRDLITVSVFNSQYILWYRRIGLIGMQLSPEPSREGVYVVTRRTGWLPQFFLGQEGESPALRRERGSLADLSRRATTAVVWPVPQPSQAQCSAHVERVNGASTLLQDGCSGSAGPLAARGASEPASGQRRDKEKPQKSRPLGKSGVKSRTLNLR